MRIAILVVFGVRSLRLCAAKCHLFGAKYFNVCSEVLERRDGQCVN